MVASNYAESVSVLEWEAMLASMGNCVCRAKSPNERPQRGFPKMPRRSCHLPKAT